MFKKIRPLIALMLVAALGCVVVACGSSPAAPAPAAAPQAPAPRRRATSCRACSSPEGRTIASACRATSRRRTRAGSFYAAIGDAGFGRTDGTIAVDGRRTRRTAGRDDFQGL